jgi:hypothetical protein
MSGEKRSEYRIVTPGAGVFYKLEDLPAAEQRYLRGVAEDVSLGGLFVASRHPCRPGSVVKLQLFSPADPRESSPVLARGVVRWRRLWREPRGMGVQFLEFEGLGQRRLESWLDTVALPASLLPAAAAAAANVAHAGAARRAAAAAPPAARALSA